MEPLRKMQPPMQPAAPRPALRLCPAPHTISMESLGRFARNAATRGERIEILRHLLGGCPVCSGELAEIWKPRVSGEVDYGPALDRVEKHVPTLLEVSGRR